MLNTLRGLVALWTVTLLVIVFLFALNAHADEGSFRWLFENESEFVANNPLDSLVLARIQEKGIEPARLCSDEVFVRRVYLDVIGTLPEVEEVQVFLEDRRAGKRQALIDDLLEREEFADYWTLKWCDLLRVKSEFPINLWPNAVQAYSRWIHDSIRDNKPYDRFVRELLTSSGSNFRVPPVNFYRAIQGSESSTIAEAVALAFMGVRLEKCSQQQRSNLAEFFSRVAYKQTREWKEEIVYADTTASESLNTAFPDGVAVRIPPNVDPREVFANWLIQADNRWFARNAVNRIWAWLMGRGIIHEPDDIGEHNPPSNPDLLTYLEKQLVSSRYDLKSIYRLILNSNVYQQSSIVYQQSSIPRSDHPEAESLFAHYIARRLDAEVLIDALCRVTRTTESYSSPIPEPFTFVPEYRRSIALDDGSITSPFLEMFGRPPRDTGLESERGNQISDAQRLHLLNSAHIQRKIEDGDWLHELVDFRRRVDRDLVDMIYLSALSRYPTSDELHVIKKYANTEGLFPRLVVKDLLWALVNSKEFLYRH